MFKVVQKIVQYSVKKGKSIAINEGENFTNIQNLNLKAHGKTVWNAEKSKYVSEVIIDPKTEAALGDLSLVVEAQNKVMFPEAKNQIVSIFGDLATLETISSRNKGALSIYPKLERGFKSNGGSFSSFKQVMSIIGDGVGSRVINKSLPKLSDKEISTMIKNMRIEGQRLTAKQELLLTNYIYQKPMKQVYQDEAFELFEQFTKPLVEARSQDAVNHLTLSILKDKLLTKKVTIEQLKKTGLFDESLIAELETNPNLKSLKILQINNYRGKHGLAEFTDAQIQDLQRALDAGYVPTEPMIVINSSRRGLQARGYNSATLDKLEQKSIKASGYRTAQMNVEYSNGALGEVQFRGPETNRIGEYEHIAYDLRQGKNTLGEHCQEFQNEIKKLSDNEYEIYNQYLEDCYNYYNRLELGLPAIKPKLPTRFNKVLSEENMKHLHDIGEEIAIEQAKHFSPHIEKTYKATA